MHLRMHSRRLREINLLEGAWHPKPQYNVTKVLWIFGKCLQSAKLAGHWSPRNRGPNTRSGLVQHTLAKIVHRTGRRHWHAEPCVLEVRTGGRWRNLVVRAERLGLLEEQLECIWDDATDLVKLLVTELELLLGQLADGWVLVCDEADGVLGAGPMDLVVLSDGFSLASPRIAVGLELAVRMQLEPTTGVVGRKPDQVADLVSGDHPLANRREGVCKPQGVRGLGRTLGLAELAVGRLA